MNVGLVGCGRIAERGYIPALSAARATLVAVADVDAERRARVAPGVPGYASAAELLDAHSVDLVVVATPSEHHVGDAEAAAERGVRALVEKPPAPTAAAAARLTELDPAPWIGFNRRFEPALQAMRAHAGAQPDIALDIVLTIENQLWSAYAAKDGPLTDLGSHAVDLATWITRRPVERVRAGAENGDAVSFELDLSGTRATVTVAHDRPWSERVTLSQSGRELARFRAGGTAGRVLGRLGLAKTATLPQLLASQLSAAAESHAGRPADPRPATAADGVRVMNVLETVNAAQARPGTWVPCSR
jgi:UDP-N-acetylglucosamine 3-dehydrogenase